MPFLKIFTNIPKSDIPKDFVEKIRPVLSKCVRKPTAFFQVIVSADCIMTVNGKDEPSVIATLESIGNLGPIDNKVIAKDLSEFIAKELGLDKNQVFLTFYDLLHHNVAKNGEVVDPAIVQRTN